MSKYLAFFNDVPLTGQFSVSALEGHSLEAKDPEKLLAKSAKSLETINLKVREVEVFYELNYGTTFFFSFLKISDWYDLSYQS